MNHNVCLSVCLSVCSKKNVSPPSPSSIMAVGTSFLNKKSSKKSYSSLPSTHFPINGTAVKEIIIFPFCGFPKCTGLFICTILKTAKLEFFRNYHQLWLDKTLKLLKLCNRFINLIISHNTSYFITDRNRFIFQAVHAKKTLKIILMSYLYLHLAW